jgi:hypothetical protein
MEASAGYYRGEVPEFVDGPLSGIPDGPDRVVEPSVCFFLSIPVAVPVSPLRPIDPSFVPDLPVPVLKFDPAFNRPHLSPGDRALGNLKHIRAWIGRRRTCRGSIPGW